MTKRNPNKIAKSFRLGGLSTTYHSNETIKIFEEHLSDGIKISDFVSKCIVEFAEQEGFCKDKPGKFINRNRRETIQGFSKNPKKRIDYTYLWAVEFLMQKYPRISQSQIIRDCITGYYQEV